jgi:sec-independent protein translocase protein TatC
VSESEKRYGFMQHIEALRGFLIRSAAAIIIAGIAAFFFKDFIFNNLLFAPRNADFITNRLLCEFGKYMQTQDLCINSKPFQIININLSGQFNTHINLSVVTGILLAFPYIFFEFWRFIAPALTRNEKRKSRGAVFFASILFTFGALFGYFVILPLSIDFLATYNISDKVLNQIGLESYIETVTSVVLSTGAVFELPILIYFLAKIGLIGPEFLKKYRRHAIVVILIIAAIITPPDVFSQTIVAVPLYALYEAGIVIAKRVRMNNLK